MELVSIRFGYPSRPDFLGPVNLHVRSGEFWAIVGPNGAGKSTLLRIMGGLFTPSAGAMMLQGRPFSSYSRRERAQRIGYLPQRVAGDIDLTALEVVLMGRFPHRSLGLFESALDHEIAEQELVQTMTHAFADRPISTLSGGEAQRVHLAAAFAGQPRLLLLDEPTAALDLQHERLIFELLRRRANEQEVGVVAVTHDVNLAADYCSHVLLLQEGKVVSSGSPADVLTPAILSTVYGLALSAITAPGSGDRRWIVPSACEASRG